MAKDISLSEYLPDLQEGFFESINTSQVSTKAHAALDQAIAVDVGRLGKAAAACAYFRWM